MRGAKVSRREIWIVTNTIWKRRSAEAWSPCSKYFQPRSTASGAKCASDTGSAWLVTGKIKASTTRGTRPTRIPQEASKNQAQHRPKNGPNYLGLTWQEVRD